jgi:hypothetical protein
MNFGENNDAHLLFSQLLILCVSFSDNIGFHARSQTDLRLLNLVYSRKISKNFINAYRVCVLKGMSNEIRWIVLSATVIESL